MKNILHISGVIEHRDRDLKDTEHDIILDALNEAMEKLGFDFGFTADNRLIDKNGELFKDEG